MGLIREYPVDFEIGGELRRSSNPQIDLDEYLNLHYPGSTMIYSDASYNPVTSRAGIAYWVPACNYRFGLRISDLHSITSMELLAIKYALKFGIENKLSNLIIISDSKNAVYSLSKPILCERKTSSLLLELHKDLEIYGSLDIGTPRFIWIPAHSGITDNEIVDDLAKDAAGLPVIKNMGICFSDLKEVIKRDAKHWRDLTWPFFPRWNSRNIYYEYANVKSPRPWFSEIQENRKIITLITRLRTGHLRTHDHLVERGWIESIQSQCGFMQKSLLHLLRDCPLYSKKRDRFLAFLDSVESPTTDPAVILRILTIRVETGMVSEIKSFFSQNEIDI